MECSFLQSHLYLFCNHTAIKLQSLTCVVSATVFFCNRSTSAVKDVCNHLVFSPSCNHIKQRPN
jgi:hypothetical protein